MNYYGRKADYPLDFFTSTASKFVELVTLLNIGPASLVTSVTEEPFLHQVSKDRLAYSAGWVFTLSALDRILYRLGYLGGTADPVQLEIIRSGERSLIKSRSQVRASRSYKKMRAVRSVKV
jgi:hypothetical protein